MRTVRLFTGARTLCDTPAGIAWARGQITRWLADWAPGDILVTGDARSDDLACELAAERHACQQWTLTGHAVLYGWGAPLSRSWWVHLSEAERVEYDNPKRRPLLRNRLMIDAVARGRDAGKFAVGEGIALLDPASKTHGTRHTITLAERAGIAVRAVEYGRDG